jgi:hypothetical protein
MKKLIVPSACIALLATQAFAQAPPPPAPQVGPAAQTAWGQLTDIQGTVKAFTLTPVGDIEGIILTDGAEVHVPPHLTAQVAAAVRPGESVVVRGWRSNVPNFVVATALTGQRGQSVIDQGPPPPGSMPPPPPPGQPAPGAQQATVQGRVRQLLHGPAGDVNGALLDDGTTVKLGPAMAWQLASQLQPGQVVTAQGWALSNSYGRVVDMQSLGAPAAQLTQTAPSPQGVAPPPPPPAPGVAPPPPPQGTAAPPPPAAPRP